MLYGSVGRVGLRALLGTTFSPLSLFASGEQGVWYQNSDFSTLFQDAAGTTPVTALEQPVGLRLDKSKGLVLGSELVTNGTFDSNVTGWTVNTLQGENTTITRDTSIFTAGGMKVSAPIYPAVGQVLSGLTVGRSYKVSCQMYSDSLRTSLSIGTASNNQVGWVGVSAVNQTQTLSFVFVATATSMTVWASKSLFNVGWASGDFYIDNISVRELPGNHAFQTTNSARPVLSARKNLLVNTATLSTQNVTVRAVQHVLSFWGTGTITLSGVSTAGPLIGTSIDNRVYIAFTPTAGTLTLTVSGTVSRAQLEEANEGA